MHFVYILLCQDGSFYTGYTVDVNRRFLQHKTGKGASYTRSHPPIRVLYTESFATKEEALRRERQIKNLSRNKKISLMGGGVGDGKSGERKRTPKDDD